jgi:hypothetical protein
MRTPQQVTQLRQEAIALRFAGKSVRQIKDALGPVGKRTLSAALEGTPPAEWTRRPNAKDDLFNEARIARYAAETEAAAAEIGGLTDREILIAGAVAYWCEGTKNKPYRQENRVTFVNSDPRLIGFFLRFLDVAGVHRDDLILRVYIHENADAGAAQRFWAGVTGVCPDQFRRPTLKHHNPKTVRMNTGDDYHGCLRIDVRRSGALYRRIEGWASGALSA